MEGMQRAMGEMPLVSVVIPTYNRKHSLKRSIDSVLGQTYGNLEIVIVDDCSTDGTMEFVEGEYGAVTGTNIVYVRNDSNLGAGASRNVGVSYANGEYIAFHDSDDEWYPDKLEKQMRYFVMCDRGVGAVYSMFYTNGPKSDIYPPQGVEMMYKTGNVFYTLLLNSLVGMITLVMRKSVFIEIGGFNEQLNSLEDYEMTLRIAQKYEIILVDEVLAVAYESENSVGKRSRDKIITQFYIMDMYRDELASAGLKKQKFDMVYQEARGYQCEEFFCQCIMQLSKDPDYLAYVQEKWEELYPSNHPEQVETVDISGVSACTGCMACYNVCPVGAVSQEYNEEGFLIPVIDEEKCIRCGRCKAVCPVCNETQGAVLPKDCYAVMGSDEIRKESSSGGVFRVLADQVLAEGGYVCGAVWNDNWQVEHIVSDRLEDVRRMMSSKYVQSNVGNTYRQMKELLGHGRKVLFTGCACQVTGLRRYLEKEYENLLLADVVCHGVPSQKIFDRCLDKKEEITRISFRDKEVFGWSPGLFLKYQDGTEYIGNKSDPYMFGFLNNWILRKTCYDCKFKNKKYSDLSLGDFWGIQQICGFGDSKGVSFVTLNTGKGAYFFKSVLPKFVQTVCLPTEAAEGYNPCISRSVDKTECRELFFEEWTRDNRRPLTDMIQTVKKRIHFDAALVYMWGINYGNALTNYALHRFLQMQGLNIVVLDNYCVLEPVKQFKKFAEEQYVLSSKYFSDFDHEMLNECCDTFIVGSDQNWNYRYAQYYGYQDYFLLDFVADDKKKVSYGTSFGEPEAAAPVETGKKLYSRFHAISVREEFGVDLCRSVYGVDAIWVSDPVFLLDQRDYDALLEGTSIPESDPYIAVYFLNPTVEKRKLCKQLQRELGGIRMVNMLDANLRETDYHRKILEYDNIKTELSVEEWLAYIRNACFVITDSYHGTCFSIIFGKKFVMVKNRESDRFRTFGLFPEIRNRIIENDASYVAAQFTEDVDYASLNERLAEQIDKSKQFIREKIL